MTLNDRFLPKKSPLYRKPLGTTSWGSFNLFIFHVLSNMPNRMLKKTKNLLLYSLLGLCNLVFDVFTNIIQFPFEKLDFVIDLEFNHVVLAIDFVFHLWNGF